MSGASGSAARPAFGPIELQALWQQLATIANECWTATWRGAFSTIIGEALDVGCELLDARGGSLAHGVRSIPVFNMIMPNTVRAVLARYGEAGIEEGDVYITNDPWLCAGHLPDVAVVTPIFHRQRLVAFVANVANVSDIGGNLNRPANRELFDEGIQIPIVRLWHAGRRQDEILELILRNVRTPDEVEGDLEAMTAANAIAGDRLVEFLDRWKLDSLEAVSDAICGRSETAMRQAIAELREGTYRSTFSADGLSDPIDLEMELIIRDSDIYVSFPNCPEQVTVGAFNSTLTYTTAHVGYALKCILGPSIPTNEGCFRPIHVEAPEGSILNALRPAAVDMRTRIGWQIHPLVFGAMAQVAPDRVAAGCGQPTLVAIDGEWSDGRRYQEHLMLGAGFGASQKAPGESNSTYPSSAASSSIEILEQRSPVLVERRERAEGSGGAGRQPGGAGERVVVRLRPNEGSRMHVVTALERMRTAPYGLFGGESGARSRIDLLRESESSSSTERVLDVEDSSVAVAVTTAGGGGFGSAGD